MTRSITQLRPPNSRLGRNEQEIGIPYAFRVRNTRPANLIRYVPLWEVSGDDSYDWSLLGDHAKSEGLGARAASSDGSHQAPTFAASPSHVDLQSGSFASRFNGSSGTVIGWAKASAAGLWTDGAFRCFATVYVDATNYLFIQKGNVNNTLRYDLACQGVDNIIAHVNATLGVTWFMWGLTWSKAADELKAYLNGLQVELTSTITNTYTGAPTISVLGAYDLAAAFPWLGSLAHVAIWDVPLSATEIARLYTV